MTLDPTLRAALSRYLSEDVLDQLPEAQALTAAIRRLNSLHQAISSFLPQYIAENETLHTQDYGGLRPGTFMFADVSGFTALSEKLQREAGRDGPNILTDIINDFFGRMLEILAKSNGQLLKFAGDALLTFFPAVEGENEAPFAIRTGLRLQRAMKDFQPFQTTALIEQFGENHGMNLTMSIGICRGQLFEAVVGNSLQRDHIIQGELPGLAMEAEGAGEQDDVIIDAELQAAYAHLFETVPVGDRFYRVVDNFGDQLDDYEFVVVRRRRGTAAAFFDLVEENLLEDLQRQLERVNSVARFVAADVVNKLAFLGDHMESENRPATVIFLHFSGFAELLSQWGEEHLPLLTSILNRYYDLMQRTIASNGGALTRSDPYQQGVKLLITFGAPIAHADDPDRAVTTALEMNRQLALFNARLRDELPEKLQTRWPFITQRCGITHGRAFAGEVGWKARREYTVMGDDVNLAARLMGKGEMGQIIISQSVWKKVNPHFETEALPPMPLKGKSKPVQAYAVKASTMSALNLPTVSGTPFVGRDLQMLSLTYALQQAKGPRRRQAIALTGEAGIGKTRMAQHIAEAAEAAGFYVAWASCQLRHAQSQEVWAAIMFQLLQLSQAKSVEAQSRLLSVRLKELGMSDLESVFSRLLFEDSFTEGAAPSTVTLPDSIVKFLMRLTEQTPVLIIIDDVHQADPAAAVIIKHVLDKITKARLMLVVTYEPGMGVELDIRRTVSITDLDESETETLATRFLGVSHIGPRLKALIWDRAHGRPLFIESLLHLLRDNGLIDGGELTGEIAPDAIPDDVRQLIVSRIDRLPAEVRSLLQTASVLGEVFPLPALAQLTEIQDSTRLESMLQAAVQAQLIEQQADGSYFFLHGVTQAAMYDSLNRMQRQKLHRAAAEFWSQHTETDRQVLMVAYHQVKAGMPMRAMELISNTAAAAETSGQLDRAIELYLHAQDILPHDETVRVELERLWAKQTAL